MFFLIFLLLLFTKAECKSVAVAAKIHGTENDKYCPKTEGEKKKQLEAEERTDLYEGDMKVSEKLKSLIDKMKKAGQQRDFISLASMKWQSPKIPYVLDSSLSDRTKDVIKAACADYEKLTCIRCVPRTNEADYIRFYVGDGCWSYVGRQGGEQDLSLGSGCDFKGTVIHEMLHALGFFHEHTRLDRDNFVTINWSKIKSGMEINFQKYAVGVAEYLNQLYDYNSIMHYPSNAFSIDGSDTITVTGSSGAKIGQRLGLSDIDIKQIKSAYNCKDDVPAPPAIATTTPSATATTQATTASPPPPPPPPPATTTSPPSTTPTTPIPPLTPPPPPPSSTPSTSGPPATGSTVATTTKQPVTASTTPSETMVTTPIIVSQPVPPLPAAGHVIIKIKAGVLPQGTYPSWPHDFQWNTNGMPQTCNCQTCNCQCVHVNEPAAGSEWKNNYLCYKKTKINPGIEWSHNGAVPKKRCIHISDPTFGNYWNNNFLCVPKDSPYQFTWSSRGPVKGKDTSCLKMDVPGGPKEWTDNFLCAKKIQKGS